jgi:hypothetical protein
MSYFQSLLKTSIILTQGTHWAGNVFTRGKYTILKGFLSDKIIRAELRNRCPLRLLDVYMIF